MVTPPTPSQIHQQLHIKISSEIPRELFWPALHIFRKVSYHAKVSGVNFIRSLPWITAIHTRFFHTMTFMNSLPMYFTLFTERTYTQTNRICPIQQIFSCLEITPSHYLVLKRTLIEKGYWKIPRMHFKHKSSFFNVKARRLIIHSHQYKTLATLSEIKSRIYKLTHLSSKKLRLGEYFQIES